MDNGYNDWVERKKEMQRKRLKFIFIGLILLALLSLFLFFFGYDAPLFDSEKIVEFSSGVLCLLVLLLILAFVKYRIEKYVPICNQCGNKISDLKKDCVVGKTEYIGTVDRTLYESMKSDVKGKTVYPRGGYAMRNSVYEKTSESTYEINSKVPVIKRFHVYRIHYNCKICGAHFADVKTESLEPLDTKERKK